MARNYHKLLAFLLVISPVSASELPLVEDCEKPVYSLDQYEADQELMLELAIKAYKECLLHVAYAHEQSDQGRRSETAEAGEAIERIPLDWQAVWPLTDVIEKAKTEGLWTQNKMAVALSTHDEWGTHVYVVLVRVGAEPLAVNITPIESALLTKLGTSDRSEYERYETKPVAWLEETDDHFLLNVRLRAWRDGQRYTVSGPVIVNIDGLVTWQ